MKTLRLILGDQLNSKHSWYKGDQSNILYCLFEMRQETDYVNHHIQKVIGFFAAMREFYKQLKSKGYDVTYFKINDDHNTQNLIKNLQNLIETHNIQNFEYQLPDEYRLSLQLNNFCDILNIYNNSIRY